jgi:hypothetical protein
MDDIWSKVAIALLAALIGAVSTYAITIINERRSIRKSRQLLRTSLENYIWHAAVSGLELDMLRTDSVPEKLARLNWTKFTDSGLLNFGFDDLSKFVPSVRQDFLEFLVYLRNNDIFVEELICAIRNDHNIELENEVGNLKGRLRTAEGKARMHLKHLIKKQS